MLVTAKLHLYKVLTNNIQQNSYSPTSSNITRTRIVMIQLRKEVIAVYSNIMPLRTVTYAPHVQYPFYETCSYVSKCPAGISYLRIQVYYTVHQTSAALLNLQCQVLQNFHLTQILQYVAACDISMAYCFLHLMTI
jgi:hypothetical protein